MTVVGSGAQARLRRDGRWQALKRARAAERRIVLERWIGHWSAGLLLLTLLYVLIGHAPYTHGVSVDEETGGTELSPVNRYIWLTLLALTVPIIWVRARDLKRLAARIWPELLLFAWFGASTRWAIDPAASGRRFTLYLLVLLICAALSLGLRNARKAHATMAIAAAIVMMVDLFSWAALPGLSMTDLGLAGIHPHKNTLGAAVLFSLFACGTFMSTRESWQGRLFWGFVVLVSLALLAASQSKTSIAIVAATAVAAPVIVILARSSRNVIWLAAASFCMLVLCALFLWLSYAGFTGADWLAPLHGVTFTMRTDVWSFVIEQFRQHVWGGVGFGSFWDVDPRVQPSLQTDLWFVQEGASTNESHNGYLDLLVTTGVVGCAGAVLLLLRWIVFGMRLLRRTLLARPVPPGPRTLADRGGVARGYALMLALLPLAFLVHNFMESSYFTANNLLGTVMLLIGVEIEERYAAGRPALTAPRRPALRRAAPGGRP